VSLRNYDPKDVSVIVGTSPVTGIADGTFVTVSRNNPAFNMDIGSDGEGTRAKSNDKSGTITITLQKSSPLNDVFSGLAIADEVSGGGVVPIRINDNLGTSIVFALTAWIQQMPDLEFAREASNVEWVFESDNIEIFIGGNFGQNS
jgi:hypothetical protein